MTLLRRLLFENLGVKLVALLLAVVVYLHVYTERPATMTLAFPVEFTDVPDSLAIVPAPPSSVIATMRGTGKQLIRIRLREPRVQVSLAGAAAGSFQRALTAADLPVAATDEVRVEPLPSNPVVQVQLDRVIERPVPVAARIVGRAPAGGWGRAWKADPAMVRVRGPRSIVAALDSLALESIHHDAGRPWTTTAGIDSVPAGCTVTPARVQLALEP